MLIKQMSSLKKKKNVDYREVLKVAIDNFFQIS